MTSMEPDDRGLLLACPHCGKRNRLKYEGLGQTFRCAQCQKDLPSPREPVDLKSDLVFDALTSRSALPILVDFWAPWCGPCKMVAPEIVKVANETAGHLVVAKVNTESYRAWGNDSASPPFQRWRSSKTESKWRARPGPCPRRRFGSLSLRRCEI